MDAFSNPLPSTYLTWSLFVIPLKKGGVQGLALARTQFEYLNATYALLITGICGFAWQLVIYLALIFYPTEERPQAKDQEEIPGIEDENLRGARRRNFNRYITLVAIWNAPNPWSAIAQLCVHAFIMHFRAKDLPTSYYDIIIITIALLVGASTVAAGILVPSQFLAKGAVAPVNPASIFYANSLDPELYVKIQQTRAPSAQRAMGIVEFARHELKQKVNVYPTEVMNWTGPSGERIERITYDYNVTGLDFGLQHKNAINFVVRVKGACTLEYGWFNTSLSDSSTDVYTVFDIPVNVTRIGITRPTGATIVPSTDSIKSNNTYAIIPDTISRFSYFKGTDPWYTTVPAPTPGIFVVDHRRPALSCWQKDTWTYGAHTAKTVDDLGDLPGLDLPAAILEDFIPDRMGFPMIFDLGTALGNSILLSSTGARARLFDASIASYAADLERLILASYVATRNILRDTTMITNTYGLDNDARGNFSIPKPGIGSFVITSGEVVSVSLSTVIVVPLLWLLFWMVRAIFARHRYYAKVAKSTAWFDPEEVDLSPMQMFGLLSERFQKNWLDKEREMPYVMREPYTRAPHIELSQAPYTVEAESEETAMLGTPAGTTSIPAHAISQQILRPNDSHNPKITRLVVRKSLRNTWPPNRSHLGYNFVGDESTSYAPTSEAISGEQPRNRDETA